MKWLSASSPVLMVRSLGMVIIISGSHQRNRRDKHAITPTAFFQLVLGVEKERRTWVTFRPGAGSAGDGDEGPELGLIFFEQGRNMVQEPRAGQGPPRWSRGRTPP